MTDRLEFGVYLIVAAIFVLAFMPILLDPFAVIGWWLGIGLLVAGGLVIVFAVLDNTGDDQ